MSDSTALLSGPAARWTRAIALATAGAMLLGGCSVINSLTGQTQRDETGEVVEGNDNADVFSIRVGDCLNEAETAEDGTVSTVPIVPCDEPHTYEAYASFDLEDGEFPGDDAIIAQADQLCLDAFNEFVGLDYQSSVLDFFYYYPTELSWTTQNDREILCVIVEPGTQVTGSLEGAGR